MRIYAGGLGPVVGAEGQLRHNSKNAGVEWRLTKNGLSVAVAWLAVVHKNI